MSDRTLIIVAAILKWIGLRFQAMHFAFSKASGRVCVLRYRLIKARAEKAPRLWCLVGGATLGSPFDVRDRVRRKYPRAEEFEFGSLTRYFVGFTPVAESLPDPNKDGAWRLFIR